MNTSQTLQSRPGNNLPAFALVVILAVAPIPMNAADTHLPALKLLTIKRPLVIGHRGYSSIAPENTLPSFKLALEAGADVIELDYHHSQDQSPIVIHDATLDRTTDATNRWGGTKISVDSKTVAELQSLDAGAWFDSKFAGTKLPLLSEALEAIQGGGGITLIERKGGDAATAVKLLRERKLVNHVVVQAFDWKYLREFHELEPDQVLGALGPTKWLADGSLPKDIPKELGAFWLDELQKTGAKVVGWSKDVTKEAVALAHQRGLKVWIYTTDDPELANRLLDLGVDGLITNDTSLMRKTVAQWNKN